MVDPTNRKSIREAAKAAKADDVVDREVVVALMSHQNGRSYIYRKLESAHVFHTSFDPNPYVMAFHEGERNQGQRLLSDVMMYCPNQYSLMIQERNTQDAVRDIRERSGDQSAGRDIDLASPNGTDENGDPIVDDSGGLYEEFQRAEQAERARAEANGSGQA